MIDQYTDTAHYATSTADSIRHTETKARPAQLKNAFMRLAAVLVIVFWGLA